MVQSTGKQPNRCWKTKDLGLVLGSCNSSTTTVTSPITGSGSPNLTAGYGDAGWWAGNLISRESTTVLVVYFGTGQLPWRSRKQSLVTLSLTEAELISLTDLIKEVIWLKFLVSEISGTESSDGSRTTLYRDSANAIGLVLEDFVSLRTKHLDVRCHFVKERPEMHGLDLKHWPTNGMVAVV